MGSQDEGNPGEQRIGVVVWITGRPSSGKSTLAAALRDRLRAEREAPVILDGDAVRDAVVPRPGYTDEARDAFYATLANLAALIAVEGHIVIVPATAHRAAFRERARRSSPSFVEVYVAATADACEERDAKGLYAAVRGGRASRVPGADVAYEAPQAADVVATGGHDEAAVVAIVDRLRAVSSRPRH